MVLVIAQTIRPAGPLVAAEGRWGTEARTASPLVSALTSRVVRGSFGEGTGVMYG